MKSAVLALIVMSALSISSAQVNVATSHNDNSRTGQNTSETILSPANVNVTQFGKLFSQTVDGTVYAQPLYLSNVSIPGKGTHNVVYVATEHDTLYAFDADNNTGSNAAPLWSVSFIDPANGITTVSSGDVSCTDLVPEIGITGTPVIDTASGTIYLVAKTKENGAFVQRLHALDVTSGAEKFGGPRVIRAKVPGTGDGSNVILFDPLREAQRSALLLQNGNLYVAWASHCDRTLYHAWVISFKASTLAPTGLWNSTPDGGLGGIWQGGMGLATDASNSLYFATGNGTFDLDSHGKDFGDSIVKLGPPSNGRLGPVDYFTPYDQASLNNGDVDLGSGGVLLLPDQAQGSPHKHLLVQSGKEGTVYLINRDRMGRFNPNNNSQIVQNLPGAIGGIWGGPAWWNNNVYFGGAFDHMKRFSFDPGAGLLSTTEVSETTTFFTYPGPTPSISANGTSNGIAWLLQTDSGSSNILHAYDAINLTTELYNSTQNSARDDAGGKVKFTVPTIANGKVYVPAVMKLTVYGLLAGQ